MKFFTNLFILKEFNNVKHHYRGSGNLEKGAEEKAEKRTQCSLKGMPHTTAVYQKFRQ